MDGVAVKELRRSCNNYLGCIWYSSASPVNQLLLALAPKAALSLELKLFYKLFGKTTSRLTKKIECP
jgi:hypothetical protein